jgi:hypothetical protein
MDRRTPDESPAETTAPVVEVRTMTIGQRVRIVEVLSIWDAMHHRLGTLGTITRIDSRRRAPYVVTHDDGVTYAYGFRSLQPIDME